MSTYNEHTNQDPEKTPPWERRVLELTARSDGSPTLIGALLRAAFHRNQAHYKRFVSKWYVDAQGHMFADYIDGRGLSHIGAFIPLKWSEFKDKLEAVAKKANLDQQEFEAFVLIIAANTVTHDMAEEPQDLFIPNAMFV